jgi:hypothetical protein
VYKVLRGYLVIKSTIIVNKTIRFPHVYFSFLYNILFFIRVKFLYLGRIYIIPLKRH